MADKKITALTALGATDVDPAADLLHIIDYSASPVNKKITVANLFDQVNTNTSIYGNSMIFEVGQAAAVNSHMRVAVGANATTDGAVTINDDGVAYVDFIVKSLGSDQALVVDAGADTVTINGDSIAALDFVVKGDTTTLIHADGGLDAVGIGTASPDDTYTMTVAATGTLGIKSLGSIHATGEVTASTNFTAGGELIKLTTTRLGTSGAPTTALVGTADGSETTVPVDSLITHVAPASATLAYYVMASGAQGQLKFIMNNSAYTAHIEIATLGGADGTKIQLDKNECCMLIYGTGGWWNIGGGTAVA
jgi:hypothetical protein